MLARIVLTAAFVLVAACAAEQPAQVGAGGATSGASGSAAGTGGASAGAPSAGNGIGGASAGSAGASTLTAGSGGNAGAGGVSGSGGGGASLIQPIVRGELDVLELGELYFAVNPSKGARVVSFKLAGDELLTGTNEHANYYGSTLWTSPADDWVVPGTFTPPPEVDSEPYTTTVSAAGVITATSAPATANGKHFVVSKVFKADLAKQAIVIDYGIENTGAAPFQLSHWEVTRVFPGGLMFFPTGGTPKLDFLKQLVQLTNAGGYTWYDNTTHQAGMGESKGGTDSPGGFIAQVAPHPNGDLLFIKAFKAVAKDEAPPGHFPLEFYCNDPHTYVELEDHSSYDEVAPGATYTQRVTWYLKRLSLGTDRTPGSAALISAATSTVGQ